MTPPRDDLDEITRIQLAGTDVELGADVAGPPDGPTVVLLHGGGQTRDSWRATLLWLAQAGYHTLAYDLRGHGESGRSSDGDYQPHTFAADLLAVTRHVGRPVAAIGASLGGIAALLAAADVPDRFWATVLVDVGTRLEPTGVERIVGFMTAHPDGFDSIEQAAAAVASYLPHRRGRIQTQRSFARNLRRGADGRYRWHWDPALLHGRKALTVDERDHIQQQLVEAARGLRTPTLLVRGGLSDVLGPGGVEEFRMLVPHAEYVEVPSATHMVVGDRNDAFTRAVADFLDAHRPDGLGSGQP